jgi:hypothetical protein
MKILILNSRSDFRISSLIASLQHVDNVGIMTTFDQDSYTQYAPDFVMSDDMSKTPNAYDLTQVGAFAPFINLTQFREPEVLSKYQSDISYIGSITDCELAMVELLNRGYNVRNFANQPSTLACYSGDIPMSECYNVYKNCKVSPIPLNDIGYRELDIIVSGGNPLRFKNKSGFIEQAIKGINGKKFSTSLSKSEILAHHTNYDRLAGQFKSMGMNATAKKILDGKKICLG